MRPAARDTGGHSHEVTQSSTGSETESKLIQLTKKQRISGSSFKFAFDFQLKDMAVGTRGGFIVGHMAFALSGADDNLEIQTSGEEGV